jgi:hypothetical protein
MSPALLDPVHLGTLNLKNRAGLNETDTGTFYQGGEQCYIDYPTLNACAA